ncbi:MAG TPA: hypothetical protein VK997_02900, partial [Deferrisomatales bacterium]|nr:hypothetical protein [Deferrisomatales bacterium]
HMAGPGKPNAYHDGSFIFIDAVGTAAAAPIYTGADIDSMAMLGALPAHAISGTFFTEGIVYVAGTLNFGGLGIRTAVDVWTPPRRELHYDHNDPAWFTSADQLPIRSDVGQSQIFIPATDPDAVKVHINGAIYVDGEVSGSGSPAVFGSVTAEQGYTGSGTPEIWYNYNLNVSGFSESLCVDCCTLSLSPTTATVSPGETVNLTALNASGVVEWKIVRMIPAVAGTTVGTLASAVGWTNKVTAGDYGTMMIRARDPNNCTATVTISVVDPCTRFGVWGNLTPTWSVVDPGDWETFSVGYAPSGAVNWNVTGWPPAGTSAVYPATGDVVVTGLCPGSSASIEATDPLCPGVTLWSNLWVDFPPGWSCGMHLGSKPANIEVGKTFTFEVKDSSCNSPQLWISASDGTDGNTFGTFTWDPVIDPTRADFTATTDSGTTTLTVYAWEAGGCFDSATFTVSSACPTVVIDQTPAGSPLTVGTLYTYQASGGTAPYTFALDAARSTALGTVTSAGADTATFTATTPGSVVITVTDPTGCISELSLWADCPWPTVTTVAPDDGDTYGSLTSNGTSLVWQADPDDHDAGGPTNNIARVEFFAWDQSWNLRYSFTDNQVQYCGFGTDACSANPGNISGWPDGTYHLLSTAYTLNRTGCGVAASSDQVDITVYNTSCPISIDPPGPRTQKKSTTVTLTASGHVGTVNWSSSDISLATVSPASGNSTTVTLQNKPNSTVFIRAEDDRCFVEYKINIIP